MEPDLDAWKRERENVARHLAWLDAEIARRSAEAERTPSEAAVSPPPFMPAEDLSPPEDRHRPATGLNASQRLGCVLLAVLLAAGVIGVFWVLPNWIYR